MTNTEGPGRGEGEKASPGRRGGNGAAIVAFVGILAVLVIAFANRRDLARLDRSIGHRLGARLQAVTDPITSLPGAQLPPDPNRVYSIRTEGAPSRGNPAAPVTIVEFADFQ